MSALSDVVIVADRMRTGVQILVSIDGWLMTLADIIPIHTQNTNPVPRLM